MQLFYGVVFMDDDDEVKGCFVKMFREHLVKNPIHRKVECNPQVTVMPNGSKMVKVSYRDEVTTAKTLDEMDSSDAWGMAEEFMRAKLRAASPGTGCKVVDANWEDCDQIAVVIEESYQQTYDLGQIDQPAQYRKEWDLRLNSFCKANGLPPKRRGCLGIVDAAGGLHWYMSY